MGAVLGAEPGQQRAPIRALAALALALTACESAATERSDALLDRIETNVRMPRGAFALEDYARYYAMRRRGTVVGIYLRLPYRDEIPGRHWVEQRDLPVVADGGCGVVTVVADASTGAVRSAVCNGEA